MRQIKIVVAAALVSVLSLSANVAQASVIFTIQQAGADVLISGSGSYDLTGATFLANGSQNGFLNSSNGLAVGGPSGFVDVYELTVNPGAFGTGSFVDGSPDTGDRFGLDVSGLGSGFITVYQGYVSGAALSGTTMFAGQTYASLGLTAGTFVYGIPNDTLTVRVLSTTAVPEPAVAALLGLGLIGIGWARRTKSPKRV